MTDYSVFAKLGWKIQFASVPEHLGDWLEQFFKTLNTDCSKHLFSIGICVTNVAQESVSSARFGKLFVGRRIHQIGEFSRIGHMDLDKPTVAIRILIHLFSSFGYAS